MSHHEIKGYHLGARLDLKQLKKLLTFDCVYFDPNELMFEGEKKSYIQIHDYGSVVFLGMQEADRDKVLKKIKKALTVEENDLEPESYVVEVNKRVSYKVHFDRIVIPKFDLKVARVLMMGIAQSIALDHYAAQSNIMLEEIAVHTGELEKRGTFSLKGKALNKYIGRTMNLKNKVASNLYVFDSPTLTWNDEYLNRIHDDLDHELDIDLRHRSLQDNMETIQDSLEMFNEFHQHAQSSRLEWIIIALIAFEIVVFLGELFFLYD